MGKIDSTLAPPRLAMVRQIGLSITATIVATLILTGVQREIPLFRATAALPELTSGGKFAARVEALRAAADADVSPAATEPMPLLATTIALPFSAAAIVGSTPPAAAEPLRIKRVQPRHRSQDAALDVMPPRRSDAVPADPTPPITTGMSVEAQPVGVWSGTKALYREALGLGGAALDRINPMTLLP